MLQLGNRSLTLAKAKEILTKPRHIYDEPAAQAKGGEGFLFRSADQSGRHDFQCDEYRFVHTGRYRDEKIGVCKRYYELKDPDGKCRKTLPGFKRHMYSLIEDERDNESSTVIYLVHYMGDSTLHGDSTQGNAKKGSILVHISTTCLEEMEDDDEKTQKQTNADLQVKRMIQVDQFRMVTERPLDEKQCEDMQCTKTQSRCRSKETIVNALKMAYHTDDFVRMMRIHPDVMLRMAHSDILKETRNVLKISIVNTELPQVISYGTSFSLGDFYLSVLGCRNVLLVGNPIFPVAFMVHEKTSMNNHEEMLRDILDCLGIDEFSNIPLVTDREKGITKLLHDFFPELPYFICLNHVLKDAETWLRNNGVKREEISILLGDICELVWTSREDQFNEQYHTLANEWPVEFRVYFDKHIKGGIARNTCRFRNKQFPAFTDGPPTNNISASMNKLLKNASEHKEMALDSMILWFHQMQTNYLNEFRRAECGHGEYVLKEEFKDMRKHHRHVKFLEMMSI